MGQRCCCSGASSNRGALREDRGACRAALAESAAAADEIADRLDDEFGLVKVDVVPAPNETIVRDLSRDDPAVTVCHPPYTHLVKCDKSGANRTKTLRET